MACPKISSLRHIFVWLCAFFGVLMILEDVSIAAPIDHEHAK
jgi:hypothetical protein